MDETCGHLREAATRKTGVNPSAKGCEDCLRTGDEWVHLRLCVTCGHVGCCDNSSNRHATKHFAGTKHPVIRSFEPGEDWGYCYADEAFIEKLPAHAGEAATQHFDPP